MFYTNCRECKKSEKKVKKGFTKEGSPDIISTVALRGTADKRKHKSESADEHTEVGIHRQKVVWVLLGFAKGKLEKSFKKLLKKSWQKQNNVV